MKQLLFALAVLILAGCANTGEVVRDDPEYCRRDSDCEIRHSAGGCGNPGCYNKYYQAPPPPSPSTKVQMGGACGYPSFDRCKCVENACQEF